MQLNDAVDAYREACSDLRDYHLAAISNRTNDVMKTLTIISTIFIPLSFVAGVYGMNFKFMPELEWKWSYLVIWIVILVLGCLMLLGFKRKKWL